MHSSISYDSWLKSSFILEYLHWLCYIHILQIYYIHIIFIYTYILYIYISYIFILHFFRRWLWSSTWILFEWSMRSRHWAFATWATASPRSSSRRRWMPTSRRETRRGREMRHGDPQGNYRKIIEKPWKNHRKTMENHQSPWKTMIIHGLGIIKHRKTNDGEWLDN